MLSIDELMERIKFPVQARKDIKEKCLNEDEYKIRKSLYEEDFPAFLKMWEEEGEDCEKALAFYLQLACEAYEEFRKDHIPDEITDQCLYDLTIWTEDCYQKTGVYGIKELGWLRMILKREVIRLGRLEFEPIVLKEDMKGRNRTIPEGTKVLNVHVPAGEPLAMEECKKSFRQAEKFFENRGYGKEAPNEYVCGSWLMAPCLVDMLPAESNIIKFLRLFDVVKVHYPFRLAEQRVFGGIREDKENYPELTTLQKKMKKYVLTDRDPGIAVGFIDDTNKVLGI